MTKSAELRQFGNYFTVDENTGYIGINSSAPTGPFEIKGAAANGNVGNLVLNSTTTTQATRLAFKESDVMVGQVAYSHDNDQLEFISLESGGRFVWYGGTSMSSVTERLQLDNSGRLLLNKPAGVTATNASVEMVAINDTSFEANFYASNADVTAGRNLQFGSGNGLAQVWARQQDFAIGTRYDHKLYFKTNNVNRGAVTGSGNFGINTTAPLVLLHVQSGSSGGSAGSIPANTTAILESNDHNFLTFLHPPDSAKFSGIVMKDNNIGGYVHHGDGSSGDGLHLKGYGYVDVLTGVASTTTPSDHTKIARFNTSGMTLYSGSNAATVWAGGWPYGTISSYGGGQMVWVDNLYVRSGHFALDRSWSDYPSITIPNNTEYGSQAEFRFHGHYGASGGDFSVVVRSDGGYLTGSDSRRKINVNSITGALDVINQLDGKTFNVVNKQLEVQDNLSMDPTGKKFGFIAQEVENIIPEAVKYYESEDTPEENGWASAYSIDYASLVPLLTNAIKEQQAIIEELKARLDAAGL